MTGADVLTWLYGLSGTVATLLYLPRISRLSRDPEARRSMGLVNWCAWSALGTVSFLYALVVVGDTAMIVVTGVSALLQGAVALLALYQAFVDRAGLDDLSTEL